MKIVIAGGTGHLGGILTAALRARGDEVAVLSRSGGTVPGTVAWDPPALGPWAELLDGAGAVVNLAGRSVDCRYTPKNRRAMLTSRVDSTRAVGLAIARAERPPRVWLQMSTATLYAHRRDAPNDEATGRLGGEEPDAPASWHLSIEIAKAWERALAEARTPHTRRVALRTAMVMSPSPGGVFEVLLRLARLGLGGPIAGGGQYVSWLHDRDFVRAVELLLGREDLEGPVNLAAPGPLPQRDLMTALREAAGVPLGLPAARWMVELGAFLLRTESELVLKSRRVVPGKLLAAGFSFEHPAWPGAARDLVARWRESRARA